MVWGTLSELEKLTNESDHSWFQCQLTHYLPPRRRYKGASEGSHSPAIPNYLSQPQESTRQHQNEDAPTQPGLAWGGTKLLEDCSLWWVALALPRFPGALSCRPTIQLEPEPFQHHFTSPSCTAGDGRSLQPPKLIHSMKGFRQEPAGARQGHSPAELSLFGSCFQDS